MSIDTDLEAQQANDVRAVLAAGREPINAWFAAQKMPARQALVDAFYNAYTNSGGASGTVLRPVQDSAAVNRLVASLSQANASRWSWLGGVVFKEQAEGGQVLVQLPSGEKRRVPLLHFDGPDADGRGHLLQERESADAQPGWFFANGEEQSSAKRDPHVRLYWAVTTEGSVPLVSQLTSQFNRNRIPFSMKVARDPSGFHRCDAGVVYVPKYAWDRASQVVEKAHAAVAPYLRAETTRFSRPLARGLGVAEDPGGGESFGQHRCTLIADLVLKWLPRIAGQEELAAKVEAGLVQAGYRMGRLHLNPGTRRDYSLQDHRHPAGVV